MMSESKKATNAIGGKTARACDSCLLKRARWYCTADDAFLCQRCDATVHSANQLASRHQRVRLKTSSCNDPTPAWHHGFTRKARTPRHGKPAILAPQRKDEGEVVNPFQPVVPEICSEDVSLDETEEMLLYRVPVFDPFAAELCHLLDEVPDVVTNERTETAIVDDYGQEGAYVFDDLPGFLPSDMDLAEFAADVECLLTGGTDEESAEDIIECKEEEGLNVCVEGRIVKVKDEGDEAAIVYQMVPSDMRQETMDWSFDYELPVAVEEEEEEKVVAVEQRKIFLRLNYEGVISAWASQGSPWTTGSRPKINPGDDCWPGFMGEEVHDPYGEMRGVGGAQMGSGDGDREARVTRYREKRRTRLFAKKIRYQVRKLNAEKRPRMKGRFVKRSSFSYLNQ